MELHLQAEISCAEQESLFLHLEQTFGVMLVKTY